MLNFGLKVNVTCDAPQGVLTPDIRSQLAAIKPEIISFLKQVNLQKDFHFQPILPASRTGDLPLSFAPRKTLVFRSIRRSKFYLQYPWNVKNYRNLQIYALEQALKEIVNRHEVLRTNFKAINGTPIQVIDDQKTFTLTIEDWQHLNKTEADIQTIFSTRTEKHFD